mgnify:CR=1 FL=1
MIPKDGKRMNSNDNRLAADEEFLNNLQEELRNLHYQIKSKDSLIDKLRQALLD